MYPGRLLKERYQLNELVESDIGSDTWVARDEVLDREVFVKLLRLEVAASAEGQKRFSREMAKMANLIHPNVMATYDTIQDYAATGAVREKVRGKQLTHFLRPREALPPSEIIGTAIQVIDALSAANEHGIFHQNLRPESVWICVDRVVKVTDYGSVWRLGSSGTVLPGVYSDPRLPPEAEADEPAQVYALGKLLSACLDATRRDSVLLGLSTEETRMPDSFLIFLTAACSEERAQRPSLEQAKAALLDVRKELEAKGKGAVNESKPQALRTVSPSRPSPEEWQRTRSRVRWWLIGLGIVALVSGVVVSVLGSDNNLSGADTRNPGTSESTVITNTSSTSERAGDDTSGGTSDSEEETDGSEEEANGLEELISVVYATTFERNAPSEKLGSEPGAVSDGVWDTYWETPGIIAGNLTIGGVGVVLKFNQDIPLWEVIVQSSTPGWSAEIYAAKAAFSERSDWGNIIDGRRIENEKTTFKMGGIEANSILLWINDPAAALTNQIRINEITLVPVEEQS